LDVGRPISPYRDSEAARRVIIDALETVFSSLIPPPRHTANTDPGDQLKNMRNSGRASNVLKVIQIESMSLVTLTPMALEIDRRDLPNRNHDILYIKRGMTPALGYDL